MNFSSSFANYVVDLRLFNLKLRDFKRKLWFAADDEISIIARISYYTRGVCAYTKKYDAAAGVAEAIIELRNCLLYSIRNNVYSYADGLK